MEYSYVTVTFDARRYRDGYKTKSQMRRMLRRDIKTFETRMYIGVNDFYRNNRYAENREALVSCDSHGYIVGERISLSAKIDDMRNQDRLSARLWMAAYEAGGRGRFEDIPTIVKIVDLDGDIVMQR